MTDTTKSDVAPSETTEVELEDGDTRHGRMFWLPKDKYIGAMLREYGEYGEAEIVAMKKLTQPGDSMIEVGANIGTHTLPMAKYLGPDGFIHAFEPQPVIHQILATNLRCNLIRNVRTYQAACGHVAGIGSIPADLDYSTEENFGGVQITRKGLGPDVPVVRLDDILLPAERKYTLIKADVEEMELMVLLGAGQIIGSSRPAIYCENNLGSRSAELIRFLTQINYRCWWHIVPLFEPDNWNRSTKDLFPNVASFNMLCLPSGDPRTGVPVAMGLKPVISPRDTSPLGWRADRPQIQS